MEMGMASLTILHMAIHVNTHMDTRMDPSAPRRTGRSIFGVDGVDGVATATGTVTSTGMVVDTVDMAGMVADLVVADMVVADTGEVAKASAATPSSPSSDLSLAKCRLRNVARVPITERQSWCHAEKMRCQERT
jgi:hypothetical protein